MARPKKRVLRKLERMRRAGLLKKKAAAVEENKGVLAKVEDVVEEVVNLVEDVVEEVVEVVEDVVEEVVEVVAPRRNRKSSKKSKKTEDE